MEDEEDIIICPECSECEGNCTCQTCGSCGDVVADLCDCEFCAGCCACNDSPKYPERTGAMVPHPKNSLFKSRRYVGVEWEFNEGADKDRLFGWCQEWEGAVVTDGSCGLEVVTPPISGDNIRKCLTEVGMALRDATVDDSCGVHVHVDARDLTWDNMFLLLRAWAKVEGLMYVIGGQQRLKNTYCIPCGLEYAEAAEDRNKGEVLSIAYDKQDTIGGGRNYVKHQKPSKKDGGRYKSLNICPWLSGRRDRNRFFGLKKDTTVEFRLHRNTHSSERLIGWAQLCAELVEWCSKASDKEFRALPKSPLRALAHMCPQSRGFILHRVKEWKGATAFRTKDGKKFRRVSVRDGWKPI